MKQERCRLCEFPLGEPVLKLPDTPLANEFLPVGNKELQDKFPLQICCCQQCGHYQLNETVDPERLFRHYLFVAGTSKVNVEHFRQYAINVIDKCNLKPGNRILDIASNDGTLLQHFKDLKMSVLGIDPARNLAEEATKKGIPTIPEFFTNERADKMLEQHEQFHLITANNVFAHIPDMIGFAKGVKKLLKPNGTFTFEVSYFGDVCDKTLFDTIYHEHSSYHTIGPLCNFFENHGLEVYDVDQIDTHGGSIRVYVRHYSNHTIHSIVSEMIEQEKNMERKVLDLKTNIRILGLELRECLREIHAQGKSIAIFGTPAKATTLMYALKLDENMITLAVDDAPLKQGTCMPGSNIKVWSPSVLNYDNHTPVLLVLAWNFADSIIEKCKANGYKGKFIVPLPELRIVE
jgi:ubiquinone/menaquinone biosynthesis C-methylase UbiE